MTESKPSPPLRRVAVVVRGVVQGVGFRPFVHNTARSRGLAGWVSNEADLVRIEVQGTTGDVAVFLEMLKLRAPVQAKIDSLDIRDIPYLEETPATFEIRKSDAVASPRPTIPADLATCADCLVEIFNPAERRYGYPFTNCTNCGPRWSIIEELPYDRPRTSMKAFEMCESCLAEYGNPSDRRFHAQPIACPKCGPHLLLLNREGEAPAEPLVKEEQYDHQLILQAAAALLAGKILALKGLGGFQLLADATNAEAVGLLRERKRRPDRPFALMMRSLSDVRQYCEVSEEEAGMLVSHQAPIVLLRRLDFSTNTGAEDGPAREEVCLAKNVAPGNPYLGVMLPYTPLHHLLMAAVDRPIVCTSGNISEEPMAITLEEALQRLGRVADLFLTHDRPIMRPVDDSIVRFGPMGMQVLRRARGFAPLPMPVVNASGRAILAVGGHLKNTVALCLKEGGRGKAEGGGSDSCSVPLPPSSFPLLASPTIISAHIGDLDSMASVEVFRRAIDDVTQFFKVRPDMVVCDLHPDYASTRHAEKLAAQWNVPLLRVQHHHAHVAACMAEHNLTGPVLGFAWDGTGYGTDGTIWGGETFLFREGEAPAEPLGRPTSLATRAARQEPRPPDLTRFAHLRTFSLPGGDAAARQPRRSALGVLFEIFGEEATKYAEDWFAPGELKTLLQMLRRGTNCPRTSSLGRIFDAVAAMVGLSPSSGKITFEGQAAMSLEFASAEEISPRPLGEGPEVRAYRLPLHQSETGTLIADWEPMVREILNDFSSGQSAAQISLQFHHALAEIAVEIAKSAGIPQIVLSGGCFQNALLLRRTYSRLIEAGFHVFFPQQVPSGDGGVALGQIFIAGLTPAIE
jgi:hydrogenase maturation protein HypF